VVDREGAKYVRRLPKFATDDKSIEAPPLSAEASFALSG
jgi:hypothetical protein